MPKFVPNWQRAHRMLSNQLLLADGALLFAWTQLPPEFKAAIPSYAMAIGAGAWLALKFFARMIDQGAITDPKPNPATEGDPHV